MKEQVVNIFLLLTAPDSYPKLCQRLVDELNKQKFKCSRIEWLNILNAWKDCVR